MAKTKADNKKAKRRNRKSKNKGGEEEISQTSLAVPSSVINNALTPFDKQLSYLETLDDESGEDEANMKKVQDSLKKINKDYQTLAAVINRQNLKSQTVMQGISRVKKEKGFRKRGAATLSLAGLLTDKVPVVGKAKQYVTKGLLGNLLLHRELSRQYEIATGIKDQFHTLLYTDKSFIKQSRDKLIGKINDYRENIFKLKQKEEENEDEISNKQKNREALMEKLKNKYNKPFKKLDFTKLKANDMRDYNRVCDLETEIIKLQEEGKATEAEIKQTFRYVLDVNANLQMYVVLFVQGEQQYKKMEKSLEQAEPNINARAALAQLKTCMVEGAEVMNNLVINYRKAMETDSNHAVTLAEHADYLVPDKLTSKKTLIKITENLRDTVEIHVKTDPYGTVKSMQAAAEGVPQLTSGEDICSPDKALSDGKN